MKKNIIVKLEVQGTHRWPDCDIPSVNFLYYPHRHIFYIICKKEVNDNNREIEFIDYKNKILNMIDCNFNKINGIYNFNEMSCEMIAEWLFQTFNLSYCSVLEDNENGGEVYE